MEIPCINKVILSYPILSEHVNSACKKASQRIAVLMWLRNLIPIKDKLQLYKAAVLPHLTYCHLVRHFCRASDLCKRLQERGLREVYNENQASYLQLLERAKLPNLMNRRLQDICILMYKVLYKLCPSYIFNIFKEHSSKYNLRQSDFFTWWQRSCWDNRNRLHGLYPLRNIFTLILIFWCRCPSLLILYCILYNSVLYFILICSLISMDSPRLHGLTL